MSDLRRTAIVTGGSQGIGAGIVKAYVERGFNVVATSRNIARSAEISPSSRVAIVEGDIGEAATADRIVETATSRFDSIDILVNDAGILIAKPFTEYTAQDVRSIVSTNLEGVLYVTQRSIEHMVSRKRGGCVITITASLANHPILGVTASVPMMAKGGLETLTLHLAMEYAKAGIRANAVAPGVVETPLQRDTPREVMESRSPLGKPSSIQDITDAVLYLTDAATVTGEILHVDGGSHAGRW